MATKKIAEDLQEVKKSLSFMSKELSKVARQQVGLLDFMEEVKQLQAVIKEKDQQTEELERRVDDLEQPARTDDQLVSGLQTTHRTCDWITAGAKEGEEAPRGELRTLEQQVIDFFNSTGFPVDNKNEAACYVKPQSGVNKSNKPSVVVPLVSRRQKNEALKQANR